MIKKIEISGIHTEVTDEMKKYINKKIGKLDKYLPLHARKSAHLEVKLQERKLKAQTECTAEVILHLPKGIITSKESTINIFAAIDVIEEKLKNQIKKYKRKHASGQIHRRVLAQIKRRAIKLQR